MRDDHCTTSEAAAGRYESLRGEAEHYDNETEADDPTFTVTTSGNALVDAVESALTWSAVMPGRWRVGVQQTAPGVVAFPLADSDPLERIEAVLAAAGYQTRAVDGLVYVRQAPSNHGAA
jgi:hypothetical protein